MLGNPEPRKDLVVESRIRDFFACGIRILDFEILNTAEVIWKLTNGCNLESRLL